MTSEVETMKTTVVFDGWDNNGYAKYRVISLNDPDVKEGGDDHDEETTNN